MDVEFYRGNGKRLGSPIVTPLLSNDMLIVRGRAEMNANAHRYIDHDGEVIFRKGMRLGQLCESPDLVSVKGVRSKLTGIAISIAFTEGADPRLEMSVNIKLRQPL